MTIKKWAFVICTALLGAWLASHVNVTLTPSNSSRVFWELQKPASGDTLKGQYVLFDEPKNPYITDPKTLNTTKRVMCEGGDILAVKDNWFYCNGQFLGVGKHYTLKGEPVKLFIYNGTIPKDHLFVMGTHRDSFDSRYFGFINTADIKAIEYPLF